MDLILLGLTFLFSLVFSVLGFVKKSPALAIIGTFSLMMSGLLIWTTSVQITYAGFPYNNSTLVTQTYSTGVESNVIGLMIAVFSMFILLYSMKVWLYGQSEEGG